MNELDNVEIAKTVECDPLDLIKYIHVKKNDLTIVTQNIRSIYCNFDDFILTLSTFKFETDVIILTECRLSTSKPIPQLNNYYSYISTHHSNQNDGVAVYVKNTLKHKIKEIKLIQASCLQVDILDNTVLCIYRSPSNSNAEIFISSLSAHLETLDSQKSVIITGDININIKPKTTESYCEHKNRTSYLSMLSAYGILPGHILPTRENNCLDHFMLKINKLKTTASIAILHTTTTDHCTLLLNISKIKNNLIASKTKKAVDFNHALRYLKENNLSELLFCDDPNILINSLIEKITESIEVSTTISEIPKSRRIIKPWITPGILRCIKNRNKLQKKYKTDPYNDTLKIIYVRYRNFCNKLIKKLKRKYERELIAKSMHNNKLLWKNIKHITFSNKKKDPNTQLLNIKSSPNESVNFINDYFTNIGKLLAQQIQPPVTIKNTSVSHALSNTFVLLDTDPEEIDRILMKLKSDSSPGWDNISVRYLKFVRSEVVPILAHLANMCFRKGIFPTPLKQSIITPVHKGGDGDDINNYRPISVLSSISKIVEKLLNSRLQNYLNSFNILSPSQFGFRQGKSTEDAVTALTSLVVDQLDKGNRCLAVFLDLKKAFDTVSVPILVSKLEKIGIRETPLALFKDYLSNRKQRVRVGELISDNSEVMFGVPQGSVLGPTLFLIYINDLCNLKIENANIFSYADDTALVFSGNSWPMVKVNAELGLSQVADWLITNLLTLNTTKTNYICFSINNRTQPPTDFNLKIHKCDVNNLNSNCKCPAINNVLHTTYLGIVVDYRLTWYLHLEQVSNRIRKLIWIFRSLRHIIPKFETKSQSSTRNLLNEIYVSLVQSILTYCIPIWGGAAKTKFIGVERAQRALLKVMYFKHIRYPSNSLYSISNLLSVRKLYILNLILKKHKDLPFDTNVLTHRRKYAIVQIPKRNTYFASIQLNSRSAKLYNTVNKAINIYSKQSYDCKKDVVKWITPLSYDETEALLLRII